jgi:tripartite-type tricarboxylate transporter receptor subunit TctC
MTKTMFVNRRSVIKAAGAVVAASSVSTATLAQSAADFPNKSITFIMPWPAGSGIDIFHRAMCDVAGKILGQPIAVDNKVGGSGTVGPATMAATAKPDGYTIAHIPLTIFRLPALQKTPWDPIKDFSYIMGTSGFTFGIAVRADSPFKTLKELLEWAKANPGKLTYATSGASTSPHIGMEQIGLKAGAEMTHVPFKGGPENVAALIGGHVMAMVDAPSWAPLVDAGQARLLTLWTEARSPRFKDAPTLKELGYDLELDSPFGIAGPRGMDPAVMKKLHDAFLVGLDDPKTKEIMTKFDYPRRHMATADYQKFVERTVAEQKDVVEKLGLNKNRG